MSMEIDGGRLIIRDATGASTHLIPLEAIASWRELLGMGSDVETVAAIMQAKDPGILDRDTGRNAWTSAYEQAEHDLLADRNQVRAAFYRARSPSGALAADGRAETRRLLGLPGSPSDSYESEAEAAVMALSDDEPADEDTVSPLALPDSVDADNLASLLTEHAAQIDRARDRFLQAITPRTEGR